MSSTQSVQFNFDEIVALSDLFLKKLETFISYDDTLKFSNSTLEVKLTNGSGDCNTQNVFTRKYIL